MEAVEKEKNMMQIKPQLAEDADLASLRFPCWEQPKIDGVRGLHLNGQFTGRSLDPFAGFGITEYFSHKDFAGFDGEMTLGDKPNSAARLCSLTTGAMGKFKGVTEMPDLHWWVFDYVTESTITWAYADRYFMASQRIQMLQHPRLHLVPFEVVSNLEQMKAAIAKHLKMNYEGTITRNPKETYKPGRSDQRQQLLRIKLWVDFEMLVTGLTEGAANTNEAKTNSLGRTERSSAKAGKVPNGQVGSIQGTLLQDVVHPITKETVFKKGLPVTMGSGEMTVAEATHYFQHPEQIVGHIAKGKCMLHGSKDVPRFPTFISLRLPQDLS